MNFFTKENLQTISTAIFSIFWIMFAIFDLYQFLFFHQPIYFLLMLVQAEFTIFFLIRRKSLVITNKPSDYLVALIGTFCMFFFRPAEYSLISADVAYIAIFTVIILELLSYLSLNKSLGIVPANRGVQVNGMYAFIRHPIYLCHFLYYVVFLLSNVSVYNFFIFIICTTLQIIRMYKEEGLLIKDEVYKKYKKNVRWRVLPGIF